MNKKQINKIYTQQKNRYKDNANKILIMNVVKHTLEKVMNAENIQRGYLEQSENIFSDNFSEVNEE